MIPESLAHWLRFLSALLAVYLCVSVAQTSINMVKTAQDTRNTVPTRTVSLTGMGSVDAVPSMAKLTVSVFEEGKEQLAVKAAGDTTMAAVQAAVKGLGIDAEDIQTNSYSLSPQYDYSSSTATLTGYQLTESIEVTIRDVDQVSTVIDAVAEAGASAVGTPLFTIENEETLKDEARAEAAEAIATQKASYENTLGLELGEVINVQESTGGSMPYPMYADAVKAEISSSAPIEVGTNTVSVQLTVTYGLR